MKTILIIEDDMILSDMYKIKFEKSGYKVLQAQDGLEGITVLQEETPDIILLDIMMPGMDGFETLESIKYHTSCKSKIVMFTNVADKEKIEQAREHGVDDYVIKSDTNPSDMLEKIDTLLQQDKNSPWEVYIQPGLNIFKMKNPFIEGGDDLEISVNIKI